MITNPNRAIFDSTDRSLIIFLRTPFSLISHLNSSSNLTKFQKISRKYLNSLWIRCLFTIIPFNSLSIPQISKFGIIFDTRPCEIDDLTVSSRQPRVRATSTPCKRSRGSAWCCHMALRAMSHLRGSHAVPHQPTVPVGK